jgi:hypothetical protein
LDELANSASKDRQPTPQRLTEISVISPARPPAWLPQNYGTFLEQVPPWIDRVRAALNRLEHEPAQRSRWIRPGLLSFLQLVGAVVFGVALYVGIAGWVHLGRQPASTPAQVAAPIAAVPAAAKTAGMPAGGGQSPTAALRPQPEPEPRSPLPFPLPKSYGVYAGSDGRLIELEQLPIKVPDMRVLVSAEISKPSQAIVPNGTVAFVVFRRDLVNSAPSTASVRVVARVSRAMKFVNGKPTYSKLEGSWRVRAKLYEYKVSPLEGQREMILIQSDAQVVLPPGRYALVLNGLGYDFTVAGKVTSTEQCLEQVEVLNGTVVSECPKS